MSEHNCAQATDFKCEIDYAIWRKVHGKPSPWLLDSKFKDEGSFEDRFNSGDHQILLWEFTINVARIHFCFFFADFVSGLQFCDLPISNRTSAISSACRQAASGLHRVAQKPRSKNFFSARPSPCCRGSHRARGRPILGYVDLSGRHS
jgi:hypothetical protein